MVESIAKVINWKIIESKECNMNEKIKKYISQMDQMPGASSVNLKETEVELGIKFPKDYVEFILEVNGAEGPIGEAAYLVIWSLEKMPLLNQSYKVKESAPYLTLFGSDGGGMGFAFDKRYGTLPVVEIAYIDIGMEEPKLLGRTFDEFIEYMYNRWSDS